MIQLIPHLPFTIRDLLAGFNHAGHWPRKLIAEWRFFGRRKTVRLDILTVLVAPEFARKVMANQ